MKKADSYWEKARQFVIVFLPIAITQIALISAGFFDTVMAGHSSEYDLAGVAIGANLFFPVFGGILGIVSGLTPIIAQLYGAGKKENLPFIVIQGLYLSIVIGIVIIICGSLFLNPLLDSMNLEPKVREIAVGYLQAMAFGFCPILIAAVMRNFIDALGYTRMTMLITVSSVPINILMNYLFIFGEYGFPRLGGVGAGVGSAITFWIVLLLNILVVKYVRPFSSYRVFARFFRVSFQTWREQLSLGVPIGSAMFCEQSIFGAVGLFMAVYGTGIIAAHQAALNFTTMIYMIPLSISMTLTILVGFEVGAKRFADARKYSKMGVVLSILFSSMASCTLMYFKPEVAALYTKAPEVWLLIQGFLSYAIFLQFSDCVSAPLQGILRGYKDVKITLYLAVLSYWILGLPTGYVLANFCGYGPYGYWIGLIAGIAIGALFLMVRLYQVQRKFSILEREQNP